MSHLTFTLALILGALLSLTAADTLVTDSLGKGVQLPSTGSNTSTYIAVLHSHVSTSPYYLHIALNTAASPNSYDAFYIHTPTAATSSSSSSGGSNGTQLQFGGATLVSQHFSSSIAAQDGGGGGGGVSGNYLRNATQPNTNVGTYTFVFNIPVLHTLTFNLTYINSASSSGGGPIVEQVQVTIFNPVSGIVGDPQFVGLRGQQYQVHGIDGAVYNIISEENTQVNSRFVFLTEGACPVIDGKKDVNCWSHPGSYLGEMSFQAVVDGRVHRALVVAGSAKRGFASVQMDHQPLSVGDIVSFGDFIVHMQSSHTVAVTTDSFEFHLSNSDLFINQQLKARVPLAELRAHGLIGQTRSTKTYPTSVRYIEGNVDDYVIADGDIFGADFVYNRFLA